ncbi:hypothetical protein [Tuwongella immobilis]|uniref:Uncharacterized protein n=1 Tax=Tuwongella immobilis TaxID=692036 RepID=A0A6C2YNQ9_9BACT|nr:hypothetical protein [Tuwongella immobilis]VIP03260.1 Uncharacterized protein OS=Singulisphaera acidiphila (strain ATCC BAA-1392 / DSM 18658 / VKM B-2454 / MOB10) GN=Sinac_2276 PE=4 SV=1 [Tuwongella immobilis]VTS03868.1 Uncharacterized protein OS=Singulisphaera acidiphila (strain ATCC BAA-1392 / DSM 18658 / VKM B-2454 / MOB10) GN=Sinac_2276 PE=4 SV=1 [Tuwongella immobilis]
MRGPILCLAGMLHASTGLFAAEPVESLPIPLTPWIEQLGDKDFRKREAAARFLEQQGNRGLKELTGARQHPDPEVRRRVETLALRIERQLLVAPTRLNLRFQQAKIADVVAAISQESGFVVRNGGDNRKLITINLDHVTYWEAIDRICEQAGLMFSDQGDGTIVLYPNDSDTPFVQYVGPLRIQAVNLNLNRIANLSGMPRRNRGSMNIQETLIFSFQINAEPKSPILSMGQPIVVEALDNRGQDMRLTAPNGQFFSNYPQQMYRNFSQSSALNLRRGDLPATHMHLLRAKVPMMLLGKQIPEIVIENITKQKNAKFTGRTAEVEVIEVSTPNPGAGNPVQCTLMIRQIGKNANQDGSWTSSVPQRLELTDAQGRKYQSQGISNYLDGNGASLKAVFQFSPSDGAIGAPAKLTLNEWIPEPFEAKLEFRNIPLP